MRLPLRACLTGLLYLCAWGTAWAQFDQYTTPGGPAGRPEDARGRLAREVAAARYHLGPVRIAPWLGFRDVAFVKTLLATGQPAPTDLTATLGTGLRLYLPTGSKITWTAYVLPEYVWWRQAAGQRRLNERFGAGFHAFGTRLTVEATARRDEVQRIRTPELPRLANAREDHAVLTTELRITHKLAVYATGSTLREESLLGARDPAAALLQVLDRREQVGRAGVRWRPVTGWLFGLGAERSKVDFGTRRPGAPDRSNAGTAPFAELRYERNRLFASADVAARSLRAAQGSDFVRYDRVTGQATVAYRTGAGPEVFLYGHRNLVYSILSQYAYLDAQRVGASLHAPFGHRTRGSVYVEGGSDGYTASVSGAPDRRDGVVAFGGNFQIEIGHSASLLLTAVRSRFNSNLPGGDRDFTSVGVTVSLAGRPTP
ncbi:MAG TPA: hypothetical protein VGR07_20395 [Thermoanaerobaculia bacterium]|nr:hypothetical protein [Thermoanaerobaculia bacterium]